MSRADLLISLIRAGNAGDEMQFRRAVEALIADERTKHHHVLADRLAELLANRNGKQMQVRGPDAGGIEELLLELTPRQSLADLVLPGAVEAASRELIEEQSRADLLRSYNIEPRHRILLVGPPGNGKTSLAEALAEAMAVPLFAVRYEGVIGSYLGETGARLQKVFAFARSRRCVLFFDEFDAIGKERGDVHETGEIKRVVSTLLLQIDALPSYVTVITASNHPELLDRAAWRRFQLRLLLPSPTHAQIVQWFHRFQTRTPEPLGVAPPTLAKHLAGASFAELEDFCLDVHRTWVLAQPDADMHKIVKARLAQWRTRFEPQ